MVVQVESGREAHPVELGPEEFELSKADVKWAGPELAIRVSHHDHIDGPAQSRGVHLLVERVHARDGCLNIIHSCASCSLSDTGSTKTGGLSLCQETPAKVDKRDKGDPLREREGGRGRGRESHWEVVKVWKDGRKEVKI